jgi:hypothetical protein
MHYTTNESNIFNPALVYTNTETVINPAEQYLYYNTSPNVVSAPLIPTSPVKNNNQMPDFSPRVSQKRTERDEPLEEGLVMHIREAFLPFNDPSPNTRASKRYVCFLYCNT